ncbi:hypothetical protein R50073_15350 [Maricurvus nonylphenolicus]
MTAMSYKGRYPTPRRLAGKGFKLKFRPTSGKKTEKPSLAQYNGAVFEKGSPY